MGWKGTLSKIINDNQLANLQLRFVSRYIHVIVSITFVEGKEARAKRGRINVPVKT